MKKIKTIKEYFNNEYKQQAQNVNFTKLPNIMGLKVTANKVIHTLLINNIKEWTKTEVLSNKTALETIYMGGSSNIDGVVENLCSYYSGGHNIHLLDKKGQIGGSRMDRGSAASRYTFVRKGKILDSLFNKQDLNILERYNFENTDIEYKFFTFNLPLILLLRSSGIGSGHSSDILPRNVQDIKQHLEKVLKGEKSSYDFMPYFNGFKGTIERTEPNKYRIKGRIKRLSKTRTEILEVPVDETYKSYIKKLDKLQDQGKIRRYEDLCDFRIDNFSFIVHQDFQDKTDDEILDILKLTKSISENFTIIDEHNKVKVHNSPEEVFNHYYNIKINFLHKRKEYLISSMKENIKLDASKFYFIRAIVQDELIINKRTKEAISKDLDQIDNIIKVEDSYDYLLKMSINSLTEERMKSLLDSLKEQKKELDRISKISVNQMWLDDLKDLEDF